MQKENEVKRKAKEKEKKKIIQAERKKLLDEKKKRMEEAKQAAKAIDDKLKQLKVLKCKTEPN